MPHLASVGPMNSLQLVQSSMVTEAQLSSTNRSQSCTQEGQPTRGQNDRSISQQDLHGFDAVCYAAKMDNGGRASITHLAVINDELLALDRTASTGVGRWAASNNPI